jgi:hypothetical protein
MATTRDVCILSPHDVGDGTLRQYVIEGFDAAAHPANKLSLEGVGLWGQGGRDTGTVSMLQTNQKKFLEFILGRQRSLMAKTGGRVP